MSTAIVVAEDLGHGFWLEDDGRLAFAPLLPDGAGFGECLRGCGSEVPRERLDEIRRLLADLEPPRNVRRPLRPKMTSPLR